MLGNSRVGDKGSRYSVGSEVGMNNPHHGKAARRKAGDAVGSGTVW